MISVAIEIRGVKPIIRNVNKFIANATPIITEKSTNIVFKELKKIWTLEGPKDTGDLLNSVRIVKIGKRAGYGELAVGGTPATFRRKGRGAPVSYAKFWEEGFSTHPILKRNIKAWTTRAKLQRYREEGMNNPNLRGNKRYVFIRGRPGLQSGPRSLENSKKKIMLMAKRESRRLLTRK